MGYSDLNEGEAFVVTVFRHWQRSGPTRAAAERNILELGWNDELFEALEPLFELFRAFPIQDTGNDRRDSAVLCPDEESILNTIATQNGRVSPHVAGLHGVLAEANITIRRLSEIPRSGHDYLVEQIHRKTGIVYRTFHPIS